MNLRERLYKFAICCDNLSICGQIEQNLIDQQKNFNAKFQVEVFLSGQELLQTLHNGSYFDLILIKEEMKEQTGSQIAMYIRETIKDLEVSIIFIFTNTVCNIQVLRTIPNDAIVVPISNREIRRILIKICNKDKPEKCFYCKIGREHCKVPLKYILYFESMGRKVIITTTKCQIEIYDSLSRIEIELRDFNFGRVHNSFIVNYPYIIKFSPSKLTMADGKEINISQAKRKLVAIKLKQLAKLYYNK